MTKSSGAILGVGAVPRNRRVFGALLGALAVSATTVCLAVAPQYALIDLGSTEVAGAGLAWKLRQGTLAPPWFPSTAGTCQNGTSSWVWAGYGEVAVGGTCALTPEGGATDDAAVWTTSGGKTTLTDDGVLPAPATYITGGSATFHDFNTVGDFVGSGLYSYGGTSGPCPCVATHGFIYNNGLWTDLTPIAGYEYDSNAEAVNDSHEVVGQTTTISSTNQALLKRAFVYIDGTTYNLTFYLVGGPTALLEDAYWIDCQGNIAAVGMPNTSSSGATLHNYLLVRQGPARTNCAK